MYGILTNISRISTIKWTNIVRDGGNLRIFDLRHFPFRHVNKYHMQRLKLNTRFGSKYQQ